MIKTSSPRRQRARAMDNLGASCKDSESHLCLGVLMTAIHLIAAAASQPGNRQPLEVHDLAIERPPAGHIQIVLVMVPGDVDQRDIELGDDVLEVPGRQVAAAHNEIDIVELVPHRRAVEKLDILSDTARIRIQVASTNAAGSPRRVSSRRPAPDRSR